jgi:hypothetical protein
MKGTVTNVTVSHDSHAKHAVMIKPIHMIEVKRIAENMAISESELINKAIAKFSSDYQQFEVLLTTIRRLRGRKIRVKTTTGYVERWVAISKPKAAKLVMQLLENPSESSVLSYASFKENGDLHIGELRIQSSIL